MLKALIFDCDGVLAETEKDGHRVAFNKTFEKEDIDACWDEQLYSELVKISGGKERMKYFFNKNLSKYDKNIFTDEYIQKLHKIKTSIFQEMINEGKLPIRTGVRRIIKEAYENGLKLYVCSTSNQNSVKAITDSVFGNDFKWYTDIYAGDIVNRKKPAPDIYNLVKKNYSVKGNECMVIEDSHNGLLAAKRAGMYCIITVSHYSQKEDFDKADLVVSSLGDSNRKCRILKNPCNIIKPGVDFITIDNIINIVR